jgi:hypothetical protein
LWSDHHNHWCSHKFEVLLGFNIFWQGNTGSSNTDCKTSDQRPLSIYEESYICRAIPHSIRWSHTLYVCCTVGLFIAVAFGIKSDRGVRWRTEPKAEVWGIIWWVP